MTRLLCESNQTNQTEIVSVYTELANAKLANAACRIWRALFIEYI